MTRSDIRFYKFVYLRRLPILALVLVLCAAGATAFAYLQKPTFRSDARILIATPQIDIGEKSANVAALMEELRQLEQQIMTRASLLDIAARAGVYASRSLDSQDEMLNDMRRRIAISEVRVGVGGDNGQATAFSISFDAETAQMAADVANELATRFVKGNERTRAERASDTLAFFDDEVGRLGGELTKIEARILTFTNEHRGALPESLEFRRGQQSNHQERLVQLQREEAEQRSRRSNLVRTFEGGDYAIGSRSSPREQKLSELQEALETRRGTFSDKSPSVVALQARIDTLKSEILATSGDGDRQADRPPTEVNIQLAEIDGRLVYIAEERAELVRQIDLLSRSIESTPNNAAVLNALNRDQDSIKSQYLAAVERRAQASTNKQIELDSKGQHLSIVERAVAAERPLKPKRLLIAGLGTAGGAALGLALVVLLEISNQTVRRPADLARRLGIQPFVTIPHKPTRREVVQRKMRPLLVLLCLIGLVGLCWALAKQYPAETERFVGRVTRALPVN